MKKILSIIILIVVAVAAYLSFTTHKGGLIQTNTEEKMMITEDSLPIIEPEIINTPQANHNSTKSNKTAGMVDIEEVSTTITEANAVLTPQVWPEDPGEEGISITELARHDDARDCWIVYKNEVYDVTKFLPFHPGGVARIAQFCGKVNGFTETFHGQHGTSKVDKLKNQVGDYQGNITQ